MDRRRFLVIIALLALVLVLAGCSVVFEAGISGKVVTASGTGTANVQDVSVFAYTDSSLRDSDFAKFQAGTITRPSEGSGYVATTNTNANGEFTVNKVVWETKKSEFGKTADVSKLYLIFYHEDYFPAKADATIISGSTNSSNVYVKLEGSKDYTTLNITVYDVSTGRAMTDACTLEYQINDDNPDNAIVTGAITETVSFRKDRTTPVNLKFILTGPDDSWAMVNSDGGVIEYHLEEDIDSGTMSVSLYMKQSAFTLPAFSGRIDSTVSVNPVVIENANDNISVWVEYKDVNNAWQPIKETKNAGHKTYAAQIGNGDTVMYSHGNFSGVGSDDYSVYVDADSLNPKIKFNEAGKTMYVDLRLAFQNDDDPVQYVSIKYYLKQTSSTLGYVEFD